MSEWWQKRVPWTKCGKRTDGEACGASADYRAFADSTHQCGCVASGKPRCTGHGLCASHAAGARMEGKIERIETLAAS